MPESLVLPNMGCPKCGERVRWQIEDWIQGGPHQPAPWTCLWCQHVEKPELPGKIERVERLKAPFVH